MDDRSALDRARRLPRHRRGAGAVAVVALGVAVLAGSGCSSADDPATTARHHLRTRLAATASHKQARCVVDHVDDTAAIALDRDTDLAPDGATMRAYTNAMVACIAGL